ncbi:ferredoxin [Streptomyces sp. NPDC048410]|uniref:ferredoxin n=1 Tax=Streptomyces sp. NPDC048410 TaxID=3365545 RepID=UPI00371D69CE
MGHGQSQSHAHDGHPGAAADPGGPRVALRIAVDLERCCGSGMCALTAPGVFDQRDSDGRVVLLEQFASKNMEDSVKLASENCPCAAISFGDVVLREQGEGRE